MFPLSEEIRAEFNHWFTLIEKNVDIIDVSHHELQAIWHNKQDQGSCMSPEDCLGTIHRLSQIIMHTIDDLQEQVSDLLKEMSPDSLADSWRVSDEDYCMLFDKFYPGNDPKGPYDFMNFDKYDGNKLRLFMNCLPPANRIKKLLDEYCEEIRTATKELSASTDQDEVLRLCERVFTASKRFVAVPKKNVKNRKKIAFFDCSSYIPAYRDYQKDFKGFFEKIKHPTDSQREIHNKQMNFLEKRIAATELHNECFQLIDSHILYLAVEIAKFAKGYQNQVLQEKVAEVVHQPLSASVKAKGTKGTAGKKANNKKTKPKNKAKRKPQKPKSKVAGKKKPMAETAKKVPVKEIEQVEIDPPLPLNTRKVVVLSGENTDVLHRNLWHQYALTLPSLLENSRPTASRVRLCATVLHGWMEKTLQTAAQDEKVNLLSHNLWAYQSVLKNPPSQPIIKDLHKGSHWTRFGREWNAIWNNWGPISERPTVLSWMGERFDGSNQKTFSQRVEKWIVQGEKVHNAYFKTEAKEADVIQYPPVEDLKTPYLNRLLDGVKCLDKKSVWILQWQDDLEDLQEAIKMLTEEITPQQLPVVVQHILMLTVGVIQSPLYAKQQENNGSHSLQHDLVNLWENAGITLSQENEDRLKDDWDGIAHLHRYPFAGEVKSNAHRLYVNAIAIACDPTIGDGFEMQVKEGTKEGEIVNGVPYLKEYLSADDLRKSVIASVESIIENAGMVLLKSK